MIPKTIHYCWFGRNPKPKLAEKCIKSWKKYCPDYKMIEWNEDNFDISSAPLYVRQAYEAKKWAFVTDYVRLWALVNYGGVYMDTDVEVIKPLDRFLTHPAFSGFEDDTHVPTGIMACEKDFPLFLGFLRYYDTASFYNQDGTISYTTNVEVITDCCAAKGLIQNNTYQTIEGFALYPKDVFCPVSYKTGFLEKTRNTVTIHWFSGSWQSEAAKKERAAKNKAARADYIKHIPNRIGMKLLGIERYERLKAMIKRTN